MKTKLYLTNLVLLSSVFLSSCSKKSDSVATPTPTLTPTSLTITVTDYLGSAAPGASVYLYSSLADLTARTNQVGTTATTDAYGKVTFSILLVG